MSIKNKRYGKVEYLKADGIKAAHCFTTRLGGVSTGIFESMNLGMHRGDDPANVEENYRILGKCIGFTPDDLVLTHQVHSDIVRKVTRADCNGLDNHAPGLQRNADPAEAQHPGGENEPQIFVHSPKHHHAVGQFQQACRQCLPPAGEHPQDPAVQHRKDRPHQYHPAADRGHGFQGAMHGLWKCDRLFG